MIKDVSSPPAVVCIHDKDADLPTFSMDLNLLHRETRAAGFCPSPFFNVWKRLWVSLQISLVWPRARCLR